MSAGTYKYITDAKFHELKSKRYKDFLEYQSGLLRLSKSNLIFKNNIDFLTDTINEEDVCFWVDPLDGTGGFIEGSTEHVTCNIGISVKGKPLFGIIGKPFPDIDKKPHTFHTYVGGVQFGMHQIMHFDLASKSNELVYSSKPFYLQPFNQKSLLRPVICASMNSNQDKMNQVFQSLNPLAIHRVAGAGNKFLHVANGKSSLYMNFVAGLKLWDTCAGDALIKSRFGVFTNVFREHIDYDHLLDSYTLSDGIIASKSTSHFEQHLIMPSEKMLQNAYKSINM